MYKTVRGRARTERGNTRGGATKKREISRTLLSINLHSLVQCIRSLYCVETFNLMSTNSVPRPDGPPCFVSFFN